MAGRWQNRIVGHGTKPADQFQANPGNFRIHPMNQRRAVKASLDTLGWVGVVIENVRTGNLVDGHERVWQALQSDNAEVPFIQVDLSPEEEAQALLSLDPMAALAGTDTGKMDELLRQVETDNEDLAEFLGDLAEQNGLYFGTPPEVPDDPGAEIDRADELREKWQTATGQMWQLGGHRIICGDCTDAAVVERVMGGERADLLLTDPPYGIGYGADGFSGTHGWKDYGKTEWDNARPTKETILFYVSLSGEQIIWGGNYFTDYLPPMMRWFVWDKGQRDFSLADCELAWTSEQKAARVFSYSRAKALQDGKEHPTQKPVDLMAWCIEQANSPAVIVDPFLGSGTTLIACERLGRKCRGVEIAPKYIAVTLERWAQMTGQTPVLLD